MLWSALTHIRVGWKLGDGLTSCPQEPLLGHRNLLVTCHRQNKKHSSKILSKNFHKSKQDDRSLILIIYFNP